MKSEIGDYLRMKKVFTVIFLIAAFIFNTGNIWAQPSAYKNDLLKIELTKLDENHYDIGLYTQKIYNEPVKIIKKSDTVYYFLLPETSHSITSVTPLDAIKSVMLKSYPYAGQDLDNSYTKVAIITSKPLELTTSLKTLDTTISPRLDPIRLAKLDQVFERYSQRLAENNIPSPLNDFRKTTVAQRPNLQSNVVVEDDKNELIASNNKETNSLEEYQNKVNQKQAEVKKQETKPAPEKPAVKQAPAKQTAKPANIQTPKKTTVTTAAKPVSKPVSKPAVKPAAKQVSKPIAKPEVKPVIAEAKPAIQAPKQKTPASSAKQTAKPEVKQPVKQTAVKQQETKPVTIAQNVKPIETLQKKETTKTVTPDIKDNEYSKYEKQLALNKPIDVEFSTEVPKETVKDELKNNKEQEEQVLPIENIKVKDRVIVSKKAQKEAQQKQRNFITLLVLFGALAGIYIMVKKKANAKKQQSAAEFLAAKKAARESSDIKEYLKNKQLAKLKQKTEEAKHKEEEKPVSYIENNVNETVTAQNEVQSYGEYKEPEKTRDEITEEEKVKAFNAYMDSITEPEEKEEEETLYNYEEIKEHQETPIQLEDDEEIALKELYTPIETRYTAAYPISYDTSDEAEVLSALRAQDEQNKPKSEPQETDEDVATIVSSSKLTETRGLYLAKFEGTTSLVGYIQDDIYVLYNFGDVEIQDTDIQSRLAQENDTDSLYIVKTGGKKLMVKSTPYDMSLEMVM